MKQKTEFVISTYRSYVKEALDFRNRFAERPFICRQLNEPSKLVVSITLCRMEKFKVCSHVTKFSLIFGPLQKGFYNNQR